MTRKITLAVWAGNSIGGTEKAAALLAVGLAARGLRVLFLGPPGPRDGALVAGQVPRLEPPLEPAALADFFRNERIDVLHQHVTGHEGSTLILDTLRLMTADRPRLIETNVFGGSVGPPKEPCLDFRCFVSRANAVQTFERCRQPLDARGLKQSTVIFNPLEPSSAQPDEHSRQAAREELGVLPDEILLLRFGREGAKWCEDEVESFRAARRQNPKLRLLLMEPRTDIWAGVEAARWGDGILLRRATSDFKKLAAYYAAGDLMLHMSVFGESYGYTIAEAMQYGLPLVVRSTPWRDNAQVELVEHGVTGFACGTRQGAAGAVLELAASAALRRDFGEAGRVRIAAFSDLAHETELIDEIVHALVEGADLTKVAARNEDLLAFAAGFPARERRIWEFTSRFGPIRLYGLGYLAYRLLRKLNFALKAALRRGRRTS